MCFFSYFVFFFVCLLIFCWLYHHIFYILPSKHSISFTTPNLSLYKIAYIYIYIYIYIYKQFFEKCCHLNVFLLSLVKTNKQRRRKREWEREKTFPELEKRGFVLSRKITVFVCCCFIFYFLFFTWIFLFPFRSCEVVFLYTILCRVKCEDSR